MKKILLCILLFSLLGCTSTLKYLEQDSYSFKRVSMYFVLDNCEVVVLNAKQYPKEYKILLKSGKFKLVENPNAPKLTLKEMRGPYSCGIPLLLSVFTLGILPSSTLSMYSFSFNVERNGEILEYDYGLRTIIRFSIWEWLRKPFVSETSVLGECLKNAIEKAHREKT
jgi:hypothetical protein